MPELACIVEGQGDVGSLPIILRRIAQAEGVFDLQIRGPYRVPRMRLVRAGEIERAVDRAARSLNGAGGVLVVLDADDDLPCRLGPELLGRATHARRDRLCRVVVANREKEAWFLAALGSLRGRRGVPEHARPPAAPETVRGAKEFLSTVMGRPYSAVADEAAFAALFDLQLARREAPSFDKLWRDLRDLLVD